MTATRILSQSLEKLLKRNLPWVINKRLLFVEPKVRQKPLRKPHQKGFLLLVVPAGCFCLGCWQVQRLRWKKGLVKDIENKMENYPIPLPKDLEDTSSATDLEYTPVSVEGEFVHSREVLLNNRRNFQEKDRNSSFGPTGDVIGAHVITPFKLSDRDLIILVNRGFVPKMKFDPASRKEGQVRGKIQLTGVIRTDEKQSYFIPDNKLMSDGTYISRDINQMASNLGTSKVFIDADKETTVPGGPIGGQTRVRLRNEHMQYIITWYGISLLSFMMWWKLFWNPKRMPLEIMKAYKPR